MAKILCIYILNNVFHYKTFLKQFMFSGHVTVGQRRANVAFARERKYNKMQNDVPEKVPYTFIIVEQVKYS